MANRRVETTLVALSITLLFTLMTAQTVDSQLQTASRRSLRLPNTTYPIRYYLHIASNIHLEDLSYSGNVTIDIHIRESTNEIVLHAKNLSNFAITVRDLTTGDLVDDLTHSLDLYGSFLIIHPVVNYQAFEAGQQFRVEILFTAAMYAETHGIYWLTYTDLNNRLVYLAATQFEPTSARLAFPCYDEPAFKSNITIRLTHGSNYMAISNMQVQQVEVHDDDSNSSTTTFYTTPPISTYLIAFVISDFEYISEEYRGVTQRIFTSPATPEKGQKALKNCVRTVAALEDYFGMNYPLAKLDHIALQKNYGAAMENWGLITYKEDHLVYQDDGDMYKKLKDLLTQNHEIAHQWFGNLVSPEWWTYAWMNEGFATYFGYIVTDLIYPELNAMEFFLTDIAERAYSYAYITVRPMTYYVEKEAEIMSIFDIISYQRAACVIKMFHHAFNQKTFVRGITKFLRKFQYSVANESQLFDSLQVAVADDTTFGPNDPWTKSVREIMLSWTHSEWIPIVTVVRNYEDNTITIRQRSKELHSHELWWIPLNFASASEPDFQQTRVDYFMPPLSEVTLNPSQLGIKLERSDWLVINKQQTGFYHVLYDDGNLMMIAKALQENHTVLHALNRAAIFQNLCPLIENNDIQTVDVIFELLKYLEHEEDLITWNLVADTVLFFEKNLFGTTSHKLYKQFVRQLIAPIFQKVFKTPHLANLTNTETLARQKIMDMACMADLPECLDYSRNLAHDFIFRSAQFHTTIDYYAMHDLVMCLGLKYLSDEEFNAIMDILSKSERSSMWYDDLIYSLRCTQSHKHLRQYLNLLLGENSTHIIMNDSESMMYLFYLYKSNLAARPVVWRFFERNYKLLCRSPFFVENFNRIAEYIPQRHRVDFSKLRELIAAELQAGSNLISSDSPRIGKKIKISELFLEKFGYQINEWLLRDQQPSTYAASVAVRNAANTNMASIFRVTGNVFRKFFSIKL